MKQFFKINEISKLYNIGPDSLRYYEKLGLLAPKRGKNNYRLYTLDDLWRLNIIRDLRRLGFPMEKIQRDITVSRFRNRERIFWIFIRPGCFGPMDLMGMTFGLLAWLRIKKKLLTLSEILLRMCMSIPVVLI